MLTDSMYNGLPMPVTITFAPTMTPESLQSPKSHSKASAHGLPSPVTPSSTPCPPLRASRPMPSRSSPASAGPYPPSSPESKRRRCKPPSNKRAMNAFLIYRKHFPSLYPHIDALERHQGPKSAIIGAMWRNEPDEVKEHFFGLQQLAAEEFRISTGQLMLSKSDPVKTLIRRDKARERRAKDEKLAPRSDLIVRLWMEGKNEEELIAAVKEYDEQNEKTVDATLYVRPMEPLGNHTNTPLPAAALSSPHSSPATDPSPLLSTPPLVPEVMPEIHFPPDEESLNAQFVASLNDYLAQLQQQPPALQKPAGEDVFSDLYRPAVQASQSWEYAAADAITYEAPMDAVMSDFALSGLSLDPASGPVDYDSLPTLELGGLDNLHALGSYNGDEPASSDVGNLFNYYAELSTFPEYNFNT